MLYISGNKVRIIKPLLSFHRNLIENNTFRVRDYFLHWECIYEDTSLNYPIYEDTNGFLGTDLYFSMAETSTFVSITA